MSWDVEGCPHRLAARRSGPSELEADRLPEVRELEQLGWVLAPQAPVLVFLPYVWPPGARTWVPDRSSVWLIDTTLAADGRVLDVECRPAPVAERAALEADALADLGRAGVPPRPPGRLWLLRPVGGLPDLEAVLGWLLAAAVRQGIGFSLSAAFVRLCARELEALGTGGSG
ncbi:DUF5956 family protein [Streptomyces sp. NPDC056144]|uniref:DUF5956 family protein n=1 Tax=unclassified Streptomyces TaxID=2593676 RepID=UPI0035DF3F87